MIFSLITVTETRARVVTQKVEWSHPTTWDRGSNPINLEHGQLFTNCNLEELKIKNKRGREWPISEVRLIIGLKLPGFQNLDLAVAFLSPL